MSRIIDRVSATTRRRIRLAEDTFAREPTAARWDELRRMMRDAEREADAERAAA